MRDIGVGDLRHELLPHRIEYVLRELLALLIANDEAALSGKPTSAFEAILNRIPIGTSAFAASAMVTCSGHKCLKVLHSGTVCRTGKLMCSRNTVLFVQQEI